MSSLQAGRLTRGIAVQNRFENFAASDHLYFYDAISPIVDAETIDASRVYRASRYGKAAERLYELSHGQGAIHAFYDALLTAESVAIHEFEEACYFESCLPIEELARRGDDTLRFGPMRPVGLDRSADRSYSLCGGSASAGRPDAVELQHRRISKPFEVR